MRQMFAGLRTNPEQTSRFFGTIAGTVPVQDFFASDNLERIVKEATLFPGT